MREISVDELATLVGTGATEADAVLIDVRERAEFTEGRVPTAVNVPMGRLPAHMASLDRSVPVYLICRSGNRSGAMTDLLAASGFDAVNVSGGTDAWIRSGRTTEEG